MFTNWDQEKNAALVHYCDGIIYAAAEDSCVTQLDTNLEIRKVIGNKIEKDIFAFFATHQYVAVGGANKKVTVHDNEGRLILVRYIFEISSLFLGI